MADLDTDKLSHATSDLQEYYILPAMCSNEGVVPKTKGHGRLRPTSHKPEERESDEA